jgi:hypothetical protein
MAKIGIGCTTYLRPECLSKWKSQIAKHTNMDNVLIYIADDSLERKGVAYRKNECLRALKDCDYVFLFDDDCYPQKYGWVNFFIDSQKEHLLFLTDRLHNYDSFIDDCYWYRDCGGVFMFMTKEAIQKVGAFNEVFETWGFEHCEYSIRIIGMAAYPMLKGTENYLYSEDYYNPNHKSSITNEEKQLLFYKNFPKFAKGIEQIYIPL